MYLLYTLQYGKQRGGIRGAGFVTRIEAFLHREQPIHMIHIP